MISAIRTWMFNKSLKQHSNYSLKSEFKGINHCHSYCIISSADQNSLVATENYKKRLLGKKKSVDTLYFQDNAAESNIGYSRQNVKWNGVPQHETIDSILSKEYDLLIFLNSKMEDHLKYLAILCNAKFKIGPCFEDGMHIFDLMIDMKDPSNTEKLIKTIEHQLSLISS